MHEHDLYTAEQVRELDRVAIEDHGIPGLTLMRRAADACIEAMSRFFPDTQKVTVYCGSGNNAGDGYIVAGELAGRALQVQVIAVGDPDRLGKDARAAFEYCRQSPAEICEAGSAPVGELIVDALLGTGLSGPVRQAFQEEIATINDSLRPVISVDIPSGLCADTGSVMGAAVHADLTVTFIGRKRGLYTGDGPDHAGKILFDSLGVPASVYDGVRERAVRMLDLPVFRSRARNSYKNRNGHVLVIGGDEGMGGAVILSSEAALRTGAGLVSVATREENIPSLLARRPEIMARGVRDRNQLHPMLERADVIVIGPGFGQSSWSRGLLMAALETGLPLVVDADGLNLLATEGLRRDNWILTPHPGEAARLLGGMDVHRDRFASVEALRERYGGVAILKGAGSLVSGHHSETGRDRICLCPYGNPGMATAGTGDVLSGIIGAFLAQGHSLLEAACHGVVVHAAAGDRSAETGGERGMIATDIISCIRELVNRQDDERR